MPKDTNEVTRVYKPEITCCPLCGSKLKYRYTVSDKCIQFSGGEIHHIKNLGYSCSNPNCSHPNLIYTSQTAAKLCIKGYTYSAKVLAEVLYYKHIHKTREEICDILSENDIEMSDRNIDNIYEKLNPLLEMDYKKNIQTEYAYMLQEYGQIMLSIDSIMLMDHYRMLMVRNFFTSSFIGMHLINTDSFSILDDYLDKSLNITLIATVRPIAKSRVYSEIEKRVDTNKTKLISFVKY